MKLTSIGFQHESIIPSRFTCDGENLSPPLQWDQAPEGTSSFALIVHDPDAPRKGGWVHWVLWNLPGDCKGVPEGVPTTAHLHDGSVQGITDYKAPGYRGPCPPSGIHRYYYKLFALDCVLKLPDVTNMTRLEQAMDAA